MHLLNKKPLLLLLFSFSILSPLITTAQNNSSPYSVLGIGDIENSYFNRYTGMGNAAVALSGSRYVNNSNAASLTKLNKNFFSMELSTRFKQIFYSGADVSESNNKTSDIAIRRLVVATKITNKWGSSVGLQPFSTAAYSFNAYKNIEGTATNILADYNGEGGVNQFYWANGYQVTPATSIGVTSSFLFGSLKQTEALLNNDLSTALLTTKNIYLRNYYFNFALQTQKRINKRWMSTYGVTYSPKTSLFAEYTIDVKDGNDNLVKKDATQNDYFILPASLNFGAALIKDNKYTFTVNAQTQNWDALHYKGPNYKLVTSNKLSFGFQSTKTDKNYYGEFEKSVFQFGLYAGKSYLQVNNQQVTDFGASVGFGQNGKRTPLGYMIALEGGRRGAQSKALLSENYINLNVTLSFMDVFFLKKKYY